MLFNFYMNELQLQLNSFKSGCHNIIIGNTTLANIAYNADVMVVVSLSVKGLKM